MKNKKIITVSLDNSVINEINTQRGKVPTSRFLNDLLRGVFKL